MARASKNKNVVSSEEALKNIELAYKGLFETPLGKVVLQDMKKSLGYGKTVYTEKASNQDLSFHLGRQSVINGIMDLISKPE